MRTPLVIFSILAAAAAAIPAIAQEAAPTGAEGRNKVEIMRTPYPAGYETMIMRVTVPANGSAPRHQHPGIESGYILSGGGVLSIEGRPDQTLTPGTAALVPPNTPHSFRNGPEPTEIVTTYVAEAGKPMTVSAETAAP